jgi:sarcosine oxidase gamma subunit
MIKVALLRENSESGEYEYRAVTARNQAFGRTAGEALNALTAQIPAELIIVRSLAPDRFFTGEQRQRLDDLMARWRSARDGGQPLSARDQSELEELIDLEVQGATERATAVLEKLSP